MLGDLFTSSVFLRTLSLVAGSALVALPSWAHREPVLPGTPARCVELLGSSAHWEDRLLGPRLHVSALPSGTRKLEDIQTLKIGQYNLENLYNHRGKWIHSRKQGKMIEIFPAGPKPVKRFEKLKEVILRSDDDIMIWEEVEDVIAATDFVREFLGDRYRVLLIDGNDARGIDIAVIVKKDLPFDIEMMSHRNIRAKNGVDRLFARDLIVTSFRSPGSSLDSPPLFSLAGVHFKSQRHFPGDVRSVRRRTREAERTTQILHALEGEYPESPIFLLGDFNADVRGAPEFFSLWRAGFKDTFDLSASPVSLKDRATQSYFAPGEPVKHTQLDAILASPSAQKKGIVIQTEIIPYLNDDGTPMPLPRYFRERQKQGSDHRKLRMRIDFQKLLRPSPTLH